MAEYCGYFDTIVVKLDFQASPREVEEVNRACERNEKVPPFYLRKKPITVIASHKFTVPVFVLLTSYLRGEGAPLHIAQVIALPY